MDEVRWGLAVRCAEVIGERILLRLDSVQLISAQCIALLSGCGGWTSCADPNDRRRKYYSGRSRCWPGFYEKSASAPAYRAPSLPPAVT